MHGCVWVLIPKGFMVYHRETEHGVVSREVKEARGRRGRLERER